MKLSKKGDMNDIIKEVAIGLGFIILIFVIIGILTGKFDNLIAYIQNIGSSKSGVT